MAKKKPRRSPWVCRYCRLDSVTVQAGICRGPESCQIEGTEANKLWKKFSPRSWAIMKNKRARTNRLARRGGW